MDNLTSSLWIRCPHCKSKTRIKVYTDTVLLNFPLYCPKCKRETKVNIAKLKMVPIKEPDA
ncbi:MAG: cysteine-rich KTR domain-containing protein [Lachnospiraceae bacterium]|nr:cysteine-rich KTR domain-containing protein [Lachnospiraceae bacterium]